MTVPLGDSAGNTTPATSSEVVEPPSTKKAKSSLFDEYVNDETESSSSLPEQINQYLCTKFNQDTDDYMSFWVRNRNTFDKLYDAALTVLSVPASSAPVERVFSFSGMFCRPHRSRISDSNLERLTYLKCNRKLVNYSKR